MANRKKLPPHSYTIAVLCPLDIEQVAMRAMLDEEHHVPDLTTNDSNRYHFGEVLGHNVVIASLPAGYQGTVSASHVAMDIKHTFPWVKLHLMVGIGGGVPSYEHDIRLGDVVVAIPDGTSGGVVEYDLGKRMQNGFKRKGFLSAPSMQALSIVTSMRAFHELNGRNKISEFIADMLHRRPHLVQYQRPPAATDVLFERSYTHNFSERRSCHGCDRARSVYRPVRQHPNEPKVHYGLIGSGDSVMKNAYQRDWLGEKEGILCFEMEAAGMMNDFQCVVIRGISDYSDSHKNDAWQRYAAAAAAGLAKEFIAHGRPLLRR